MGLFHRATITPSKADLITNWVPTQPWCPAGVNSAQIDVVGAFRFDDPENQVGMEVHMVRAGEILLQVPLSYRNDPLAGAQDALVAEMEHSALGTRHVYDGTADDRFVTTLAGVAMTGQGEALGMVFHEGRWIIAPANVRVQGGGWTQERAAVSEFKVESSDPETGRLVFTNDRFRLQFLRRPATEARPLMGLSATWDGLPDPVLLTTVTER